jgi:glycosyltransferase involved in cell wall biosynthesis
MRILLIGDTSGHPDEGMKKITRHIWQALSDRHDVRIQSMASLLQPRTLLSMIRYRPHVIHTVHGPSIRTVMLSCVLRFFCGPETRVIASATRPDMGRLSGAVLSLFRPDRVLVQSSEFESVVRGAGIPTTFLPNGVDCHEFFPVTEDRRRQLRAQYGLAPDKPIILHVGHLKPNRNLDIFSELAKEKEVQVVIVASTSTTQQHRLKEKLMRAGCHVIDYYVDNIAHLYQAADVYLFPLEDQNKKRLQPATNRNGAIDIPLSVLEAMACNLRIITTEFGALPRLFKNGYGFNIINELTLDEIRNIYRLGHTVNTRRLVCPYDWKSISSTLEILYDDERKN